MATITPYLAFNGNCREALTAYGRVFGVAPTIQTFGESQMDTPDGAQDRVMHGHLDSGHLQLMASDTMPGQTTDFGSNVSLSVHCDDEAQQTHWFEGIAEGGTVTMPLGDTFWGARFGMCTDRFGVQWMFNLPRATPA